MIKHPKDLPAHKKALLNRSSLDLPFANCKRMDKSYNEKEFLLPIVTMLSWLNVLRNPSSDYVKSRFQKSDYLI